MTTAPAGPSFRDVPIDTVRDFWDRRPCNIRHSRHPVGTRAYFDEVRRRKYFVEPHIPGFAQFERWKGKRVLEVGCGIGTDTIEFARAGAHVTAIDLSMASLELAARRAQIYGVEDQIEFYQMDVERIDECLEHTDFDLIYSFGVLHHTPDPDAAFARLRGFLAPTGELRVMVYHRYSWKAIGVALKHGKGRLWEFDRIVARRSEAQTGCPVTYTFTPGSLGALLRRHDFEPREMRIEHIFPYRIRDYVENRHVREWWWRMTPRRVFRRLERSLGWHLCAVAGPARSSQDPC